MIYFFLALIALLCWSGSDLFSKIGSKPDDKYSHWKMVMAVGLVMGLHAVYEIFVNGVSVTFMDIVKYLPSSFFYILSMVLGYVGLRYIELSISSPICNSSGALAWILCLIFIPGTDKSPLNMLGAILICVGVLVLSIVEYRENDQARELRQQKANVKYAFSPLAIALPILYCLFDAAGTFADELILDNWLSEDVANVAYELTFLFMGILSFIYVVLIKRSRLGFKRDGVKLLGGIFETAGQFAYIYVIGSEFHAGIPMISAYCTVSMLWSRIFLKEKLSWKHYTAIAVVVFGIITLGISEMLAG